MSIIRYRLYADDSVHSKDEFSEYPEDYSDDYKEYSISEQMIKDLEEEIYNSDFQFSDIENISKSYNIKYKIPYIVVESIVYSIYDNLDNNIGFKDES